MSWDSIGAERVKEAKEDDGKLLKRQEKQKRKHAWAKSRASRVRKQTKVEREEALKKAEEKVEAELKAEEEAEKARKEAARLAAEDEKKALQNVGVKERESVDSKDGEAPEADERYDERYEDPEDQEDLPSDFDPDDPEWMFDQAPQHTLFWHH